MNSAGAEKAWEMLRSIDCSEVSVNAAVRFDNKKRFFMMKSFCSDFYIYPQEEFIKTASPSGELVLNKYGFLFSHACLWYLVHARNIPLTGRLLQPVNLRGGDQFFKGTHELPLSMIADLYGNDGNALLRKAKDLCGEVTNYGDMSVTLFPMPRIPVTIILWLEDAEFKPRADLLFDSSCQIQLPLDMIWSVALLCIWVLI